MPDLIIKTEGAEEPQLTECESSHEFLVRPGVPPLLKFVAAPSIIILQFMVFLLIFDNLKVSSCTDYTSWNPDVKYGIPLASIWVASEIAHQVIMALRMLLAGLYSGSPWTTCWSLVLIGQFCFETQVYATVMASSLSLQDLIQDFISLAVTNECDDKVAAALGVEGGKVMFMDTVEQEEYCNLMGELEHPSGSKEKPSLKARTAASFLWFLLRNSHCLFCLRQVSVLISLRSYFKFGTFKEGMPSTARSDSTHRYTAIYCSRVTARANE